MSSGSMKVGCIRFGLHFEHVAIIFCRDSPTFVLEGLFFLVKIALIENMVFLKTLPRSIYLSYMIKSGGQGVLKRKNYWPQVSVFLPGLLLSLGSESCLSLPVIA